MSLGICTIIVVAVYAIAEIAKKTVATDDKRRAYLPYAGALIGALIGIALFAYDSTMIEATNALEAILIGAGSGLIATGANQLYKQTNKILRGDFVGLSEGLDEILESAEEIKKEEEATKSESEVESSENNEDSYDPSDKNA